MNINNNFTKIFLVFLVVTVWGIVFYRLFSSSENKVVVSHIPKVIVSEKKEVGLLFNYKDPFKIAPKKITIVENITPETPPTFRYKGLIEGKKCKLVIVENRGFSEIIELRDSLLGFRVLSVNNDSLVVRQRVKRYNLVKN